MSSVISLTAILSAISVPGLALALVAASARRYLRSDERQLAHAGSRDRERTHRRREPALDSH